MLVNKEKLKKEAKIELINNAKAKFMEEYFLLNQQIKDCKNEKGEEYKAILKRIEKLEHNMNCLSTLKLLADNDTI